MTGEQTLPAAAPPAPIPPGEPDGPATAPGSSADPLARGRAALAVWQARLLDLTKANRLLNFRVTRLSTVPIEQPGLPALFDWLVLRDRPVPLASAYLDDEAPAEAETPQPPAPRPNLPKNALVSPYRPKQLHSALYNLRQRARASIEERGVNVLYVALGFLAWQDPQDRTTRWRAPLVLAPVAIERAAVDRYLVSALEEDVVLNPTLAYKLAHDFRLALPELPDDLEAFDLEDYLSAVGAAAADLSQAAVEPHAYLGLFSFLKIPMYEDLARHASAMLQHPLIAQLAGLPAPAAGPGGDARLDGDLDSLLDPRATFQVLDADSSQQEALLAARAGANLLIQGPPGTGKSQTIANLIAESLMAGRRILFVSEKAAALEVVRRRLSQCGLGDACLELHSHRVNKKDILAELRRTLEAPPAAPPAQAEPTLDALARTRAELNDYVRALHAPRFALQRSAFEMHGRLARLRAAPRLVFPLPGVTEASETALREREARLSTLAGHAPVIDGLAVHPWRGLRARPPSFAFQHELRARLEALANLAGQIQQTVDSLRAQTGLPWPADLRQLESVAQFLAKYRAEALALPAEALRSRFETDYASWTRYLQPGYWGDLNTLRSVCRAGWTWNYARVKADLKRLEGIRGWLGAPAAAPADDTLWPQAQALGSALQQARSELAYLREQYEPGAFEALDLDRDAGALAGWCRARLAALPAVDPYLAYAHERDRAVAEGLGDFIGKALEARLPAADWPAAYLRAFCEAWLDEAGRAAPQLAYFARAEHEARIARFQELDREQLRLARQAVAARVSAARPRVSAVAQHAASAEINILVREFHKQRRIKPLRKLFREAPNVIQALKPCFMMSPLTVSQFLEPDRFEFDLVVFDEASQVKVEDALGCLYRGRQLVVAGDNQQLPPTRFFDVLTSDEDWDETTEEEADVYESILDALAALPAAVQNRMLLWHYRSRHEALIAFSNKNFYENRLFTFPHPQQAGGARGIEFVHVPDGVYERGGARHNRIEAARVVDLILQHAGEHPAWSLAVVTFSDAQRDAVQQELDRRLEARPALRAFFADEGDEPFRIKNLELIQGDERDVVIFSVGYGRDESGKPPPLHFGPLNKAGGRRRLNVAVTRARRRVVVVSSMQPEDLARGQNEGVRLLREYMLLARDGLGALLGAGASGGGALESPLEADVYERLARAGLEAHPQVGCSGYRIDLAIVDPKMPGRYCLGVECDGATYHAARTARDRDRLRRQVLEGLGWRLHRIWSRDWNLDPDAETERVLALVQQYAGEALAPATEAPPPPDPAPPPPAPETPPLEAPPPAPSLPEGAAYYRPFAGPLTAHVNTPRLVAEQIARVVETQGPTHVEAVTRTLTAAWGFTRTGSRIQGAARAGLQFAAQHGLIRLSADGQFVWPRAATRAQVLIPPPSLGPRPTDEIAPEELEAAVRLCLREAGGGASPADLASMVFRLYGHQRASEKVTRPIYAVLERMQQAGALALVDGVARLAG